MKLAGIHHVSALTADGEANLRFYTRVLGMRLVKKTVNQDDPHAYHLFYADAQGSPGTDLTFFVVPRLAQGRPGRSSISRVGLRVPSRRALEYWAHRLAAHGVPLESPAELGGRPSLGFRDPEGLRLALVVDDPDGVPGGQPWKKGGVPEEFALRGLGPVTLTVGSLDPTARMLTEVLGFRLVGSDPSAEDPSQRAWIFRTGRGGPGAEVHVVERPDLPRERLGRGGVHHVAFRVPTEEEHARWLPRIQAAGFPTSGIVDRYYFRSIYFREPAGILLELATDGPGFLVDEDVDHLGKSLALPPFLEPLRQDIEARLPPLALTRD